MLTGKSWRIRCKLNFEAAIKLFARNENNLRKYAVCFKQFGVLVFITFTFVVMASAQPGYVLDKENESYLRETLGKIKKLSAKIRSFPKNHKFYGERATLYLDLFLIFGAKVQFQNVVYKTEVDKKSIKDFNAAINLNPEAEYFLNRGRVYEKLWHDDAGELGFMQTVKWMNKDNPPVSWQTIEAKFIQNSYFKSAEKDFIEAVNRASFHQPKNNHDYSQKTSYGDNYLINLYYRRAFTLTNNTALSKTIVSENKVKVVLEDWNKFINYYKERVGTENEMANDGILLKLGYELKTAAVSRLKPLK